MTKPKIRRRGVTLVEAILVVVVLAVAAVATSFTFNSQSTSRREAKIATVEIGQVLRMARIVAQEKQTIVDVSHAKAGGSEHITVVEQPSVISPGRSWQTTLTPGVTISGSPKSVQFRADGTTDRSLDWRVIADKLQGQVTVSAIDGSVTQVAPK